MVKNTYEFGYFPRHKYKDLVFYVKIGENSNDGLFEMPDTEENRALMEALTRSTQHTLAPDIQRANAEGFREGYQIGEKWLMGHDAALIKQEHERVLPTDKELEALKQAVCHALNDRIDGFELADNYYHKLKTMRGDKR